MSDPHNPTATPHVPTTSAGAAPVTEATASYIPPRQNVTHVTDTPRDAPDTFKDRVRWGPVLAGLVAVISTTLLLTVLGTAIAGTAYDAGDSLRAFGIGAGIWGIITALAAFFIGGLVAGGTSAVPGRGWGALNGALVWAVTIPVTLWLLASIVGATARTAGGVAATTATTAGSVAGGALQAAPDAAREADRRLDQNPELRREAEEAADAARDEAGQLRERAESAVDDVQRRVENIDRRDVERVAERVTDEVGRSAWWTLLGLLLSLGAATAGGFLASRDDDPRQTTRRY